VACDSAKEERMQNIEHRKQRPHRIDIATNAPLFTTLRKERFDGENGGIRKAMQKSKCKMQKCGMGIN
jgi:hypothetical protein